MDEEMKRSEVGLATTCETCQERVKLMCLQLRVHSLTPWECGTQSQQQVGGLPYTADMQYWPWGDTQARAPNSLVVTHVSIKGALITSNLYIATNLVSTVSNKLY